MVAARAASGAWVPVLLVVLPLVLLGAVALGALVASVLSSPKSLTGLTCRSVVCDGLTVGVTSTGPVPWPGAWPGAAPPEGEWGGSGRTPPAGGWLGVLPRGAERGVGERSSPTAPTEDLRGPSAAGSASATQPLSTLQHRRPSCRHTPQVSGHMEWEGGRDLPPTT